MKYLILLFFLLISSQIYSADNLILNGKEGKVIADKPIADITYYKVSDKGISDTILQGRAIVDADRARKQESYKTPMTQEDRVATNYKRLTIMRDKLKALGFNNEGDLIKQSKAADKAAGIPDKECWK